MNQENETKIALFQSKEIRKVFHKDEWWFVIVDVVSALTDSVQPSGYIKDMRKRDEELSKGWGQIATPLEILTEGGKQKMNCANTEGIFRIIQSIPSPKAEPFKLWLAKVGYERVEEMEDPELAFDRAMKTYLQKGYSKEWINQRLKTIEVRKELTDEWGERGANDGKDYAILTNEINKAWTGMSVKEYKEFKGLKKQNLRDNMSNLELVLNMLAEVTTTELHKGRDSKGMPELKRDANDGGGIAGNTRKEIERKSGKKVLRKKNELTKI